MNNIKDTLTKLTELFTELCIYCNTKRMSKPESTEQEKVMIILVNDINEIAKSFISLYSDSREIGYQSFIRIAYEKYIYLLHILENIKNAKAYFYYLFIHQIIYYNKFIEGTDYNEALSRLTNEEDEDIKNEILRSFSESRKEIIDFGIIDKYKECFDFEVEGESNFFRKHEWYNSDNKTGNFKELAKKLNKLDEYMIIYEITSSEIHSKGLGGRYKIEIVNSKTELIFHNDTSKLDNDSIVIMYTILCNSINLFINFFKPPHKYKNEINKYLVKL